MDSSRQGLDSDDGVAPDAEPIPECRGRIIVLSLLAGFAANLAGALFAVNATLFPSNPQVSAAMHAYRAWIFVLPFGTAAGLYAYYVLPLFRASATLSTYRTKILGFPLFFVLNTSVSWFTSFVQGAVIAMVIAPDRFWLDLLSSEIGVLGISFISMAIGYFLFEYLNRRYWIPRLFRNRLETYKNTLQPSIAAKFAIYYLGTSAAPILVLGWIIFWIESRHHVLSREQFVYMVGFLAFVAIAGVRITALFSALFHAPLVQAREATDRIARGDYDVELTVHSNDELGVLGERINGMASSLKSHSEQIRRLGTEIEQTQKEVVFTMGAIGESRSKETGNHVKRVAEYSKVLALAWGLGADEAELLRQASPMHDIGKVAIPDAILNKPGKLSAEEFEVMKTHAAIGYEMLRHSKRELLQAAAIVAHQHHEKFDGSGYPAGLSGDRIHIYGRITAVADVFDALGSERAYKAAWRDEDIFALLRAERGRHFDPRLVDLFFSRLDALRAIRDEFKDPVPTAVPSGPGTTPTSAWTAAGSPRRDGHHPSGTETGAGSTARAHRQALGCAADEADLVEEL